MPTDPATVRARADLDVFISRFTPAIAALVRSVLARMRAHLPGATELVYDKNNALVVGFGPTERPSDAWFSVVAYPTRVRLFVLQGVELVEAGGDPHGLLEGGGGVVRSFRIDDAARLGERAVVALVRRAVAQSGKRWDRRAPARTIIRAVAARQRQRRPTPAATARSARPAPPFRTRD